MYTRKPRTQQQAEKALEAEGERKPIIADLQGRNRIEYKTYPSLKAQVVQRNLTRLPYMRRWLDFKKRNSTYVAPALQLFQEIRLSGRTVRPRVAATLDGTGIRTDEFLKALSDAKLLTVKRGRAGGIYYPAK